MKRLDSPRPALRAVLRTHSITQNVMQQCKDKYGSHTKERGIIEEVWLTQAAGAGALARSRGRALPEYGTISGFIRKTMRVVSEIIARERETQKQTRPPENTDLKIHCRD